MATIIRRRRLGMSSVRGISSFSEEGISWVRSDRALPEDDLYIRWGCTASVPSRRVINTSEAIHEVNDKASFRIKLSDEGLAAPSMSMREMEGLSIPSVRSVLHEAGLVLPVVCRPVRHAQGRRLYVATSIQALRNTCINLGFSGYISNMFDKVAEYRVAVAQGRVVWVAKKTPSNPEDVAWNVARGGRFDNVRWDEWPLKAVRKSIESFNLSSLDFGGVDIMVDAEGGTSVLEINSAPSLTSPYRQESFAKVFDYMVVHGKERIPLIEDRGGYRKFIHPALTDRAQLVGG